MTYGLPLYLLNSYTLLDDSSHKVFEEKKVTVTKNALYVSVILYIIFMTVLLGGLGFIVSIVAWLIAFKLTVWRNDDKTRY